MRLFSVRERSGFCFLSKHSCSGGEISKGAKQRKGRKSRKGEERVGARRSGGPGPRAGGRGDTRSGRLRRPVPRKGGSKRQAKAVRSSSAWPLGTSEWLRPGGRRVPGKTARPAGGRAPCPLAPAPRTPHPCAQRCTVGPGSRGSQPTFPAKSCLCLGPLRTELPGAGEGRRCSGTQGSAACSLVERSRQLRQSGGPASLGWAEKQGQVSGCQGVPGLWLLGTSGSPMPQACGEGRRRLRLSAGAGGWAQGCHSGAQDGARLLFPATCRGGGLSPAPPSAGAKAKRGQALGPAHPPRHPGTPAPWHPAPSTLAPGHSGARGRLFSRWAGESAADLGLRPLPSGQHVAALAPASI